MEGTRDDRRRQQSIEQKVADLDNRVDQLYLEWSAWQQAINEQIQHLDTYLHTLDDPDEYWKRITEAVERLANGR